MEGAEALTEKISAQKDVYELDDKLYKLQMKGKCLFVCPSDCSVYHFVVLLSLCVSLCLSLCLSFSYISPLA
jgi:hypothetical protein